MNIQIFGKTKCFGTKSAERFFKERKIKYQMVDINTKGLSMKELDSVILAVGNINLLIDTKSPLYNSLNIAMLRSNDAKKLALVNNPRLLATPIVRDCETRKATVGDAVEIWKSWLV